MEIIKKITLLLTSLILLFNILSIIDVYAATIPNDGIVEGEIDTDNGSVRYCKSITSQRTGGPFRVENQGYRISLIESNTHIGDDIAECAVPVRCILDIVNSDVDPSISPSSSCTASYGFKNNKRYDYSHQTIKRLFTGEYDTENDFCTDSVFVGMGMDNKLADTINDIQGQSKLYYRHSYASGYIEQGLYNFHGSVCDNRHIVTKSQLADAGYTIKNNNEFWFYSESSGYKTAQFYDKKENQSVRFFMALIKLFDEKWNGFDINNLQNYYFMFEPIIWFDNATVYDKYSGFYSMYNVGLNYSFYGTLTELAFIQLNSRSYPPNGGYYEAWKSNRIGFAGIGNDDGRSVSGAWLDDMQVCSFVDGGAMMLRTTKRLCEGEPIVLGGVSSEFLDNYGRGVIGNYTNSDEYCYPDYVVECMGVACLQYNPPITYTAQNYSYRTGTEVVTSIKLTNNSGNDFLPMYEEVASPAYAGEPVALGAMLEYTDESGNALSNALKTQLGLQEFVSIQGIGSEQNFNSQRTTGFEITPANETYLYFKWKTSDTPMKINVTARFVGDRNMNPIYIKNSAGSIIGENLEYNGENPAYQGKTFTTVTFTCDIQDTIEKINENNVPPDTISGFMDMPTESSTSAEQKLYADNVEIFNNFDPTKSFNMQDYLIDPANESETVDRLVWFEYRAYLDSGDPNDPVKLQMKEFRADSWMQQQNFTQTWTSSGKNPIVTFDNVPQEIKSAPNGKVYKYIPSGYGFTYAFEEDYQGRNDDGIFGFNVADEDKETVKNACTMFQNGVMLFPEFNYSTDYIRTIESCGYEWFDGDIETYDSVHALSHNENSLYTKVDIGTINDYNGSLKLLRSRVHFIPVWFPDDTEYNVEVIMFDYWTPAGQIYDHKTYTLYIDGNIYDNWYPTKSDVNQKK